MDEAWLVQCQRTGGAGRDALGERVALHADRLVCTLIDGFLSYAVLLFLLQGVAAL